MRICQVSLKKDQLVWVFLRELKTGSTLNGYLEHILIFPNEFFAKYRRTKGAYFFAFSPAKAGEKILQISNVENSSSIDFTSVLNLISNDNQRTLTLSPFQGKPFAFYSQNLDPDYSGLRFAIATPQTAIENWRKSLNIEILSVTLSLAIIMVFLAWLVFKTQSKKEHKLVNRRA